MTGPYHYQKAEEMPAEIGACRRRGPTAQRRPWPSGLRRMLLLRSRPPPRSTRAAGSGTSGTTSQGLATRTPGDRVMGPAAARPRQCWHLASQGAAQSRRA